MAGVRESKAAVAKAEGACDHIAAERDETAGARECVTADDAKGVASAYMYTHMSCADAD